MYKVIKPSAFRFRTARQEAAFHRAMEKFKKATGCGLDLLALKRNSEERRAGSIADIASWVYRLIRKGVLNPGKALNLTRESSALTAEVREHRSEVEARKKAAREDLAGMIDVRALEPDATLTGLYVRLEDILRMDRQ